MKNTQAQIKRKIIRISIILALILALYLFIQPIYLSEQKSWGVICKTCSFKTGDIVIVSLKNSSISSQGVFISSAKAEIKIEGQNILESNNIIYSLYNPQSTSYITTLKEDDSFIIKTSGNNNLIDYGVIPTNRIKGKLITW